MNQPPLNPDVLTSNAELFKVASTHHFHGIECLCGFKSARSRDRTEHIMLHTLAAALPEVTSVEQWDALPIGTMVRVHFNGNSELIIRCPANSGAGIGGMSFIGGRWWTEVFTVWNADTLEIKYIPEVKP